MVAVVLFAASFLVGFSRGFELVENVGGADADAYSVGDAYVEVYADRGSVDAMFFAYAFFFEYFMSVMSFDDLPSVWK